MFITVLVIVLLPGLDQECRKINVIGKQNRYFMQNFYYLCDLLHAQPWILYLISVQAKGKPFLQSTNATLTLKSSQISINILNKDPLSCTIFYEACLHEMPLTNVFHGVTRHEIPCNTCTRVLLDILKYVHAKAERISLDKEVPLGFKSVAKKLWRISARCRRRTLWVVYL